MLAWIGCKSQKSRLASAESDKLDLSKVNEEDPREHLMKIGFGCRMFWAFRGRDEYVNLSRSTFSEGVFNEKHPFAGQPFVALKFIGNEKTHKLSVHASYLRDTTNIMRAPINHDDPRDFGASLLRLFQKMASNQDRIYCQPVLKPHRQRVGGWYYPNKPLGENTVSILFKDGAKILGLKNPEEFGMHSLRAYCITTMANSEDVSLEECMNVARHSSVAANVIYQERSSTSEGNRMKATGGICQKRATKA